MCRGLGCILITAINFVLLIAGLVCAIVGGLLKWNDDFLIRLFSDVMKKVADKLTDDATKYLETTMEVLQTLSSPLGLALFIAGLILLAIAISGLVGTWCNIKCFLFIYVIVIGVVVLAQIIVLIIYAAKKDWMIDQVDKLVEDNVYAYESIESGNPPSIFLAILMPTFECCGANGPGDFKNSSKFKTEDTIQNRTYTNLPGPIACCKFEYLGTGDKQCPAVFDNETTNTKGCLPVVEDFFKNMAEQVALYSLIPLAVLVLVLASAVWRIKSGDE